MKKDIYTEEEKEIRKIEDLNKQIRELKKDKKKSIDNEIREKKRLKDVLINRANRKYKENNKKKILILDILFCMFILYNLGALLITNALVMKDNTNKTFHEANPVAAKAYGFHTEQTIEFISKYFGLMLHLLCWSYLITMYIVGRNRYIVNNETYCHMLGSVLGFGFILTYDFINDLGYWLGKVIFSHI